MQIKKYLKTNMLVLVLLLTIATKLLEWTGQYLIGGQVLIFSIIHAFTQILFIVLVAGILFPFFNYIKVKKKDYLLIPVLAYLIKEIYNFLFVYGRVINQVTIIALVLEPLMLFGIIYYLNKSWLKIK